MLQKVLDCLARFHSLQTIAKPRLELTIQSFQFSFESGKGFVNQKRINEFDFYEREKIKTFMLQLVLDFFQHFEKYDNIYEIIKLQIIEKEINLSEFPVENRAFIDDFLTNFLYLFYNLSQTTNTSPENDEIELDYSTIFKTYGDF